MNLDKIGVYGARVIIDGKEKKVPSSFFPEHWDLTDVTSAIKETYANKEALSKKKGKYKGYTSEGIEVYIYLDKDGTVKTAKPIYQGNK